MQHPIPPTTNTTVKRAREAYLNKNYEEALRAYKILKAKHKTSAFDLNIKFCSDRLKTSLNIRLIFQPEIKQNDLSFLNIFFDKVYLVNLETDPHSRIRAEYCLAGHNIKFSVFRATNGYAGDPLEIYKDYLSRPLGNLKRFPDYNQMEIKRGKGFIESAGAIGYIFTYRRIIQDAISRGLKSILILEDDVAFIDDACSRIKNFLNHVPESWKILHLGSSQYGWENISIEDAHQNGFYYPSRLQTCGSFAIGINHSAFYEIIELVSHFEAPFDHLPLGEIYESSIGQCFSAFPAIAIPDVSQSRIRHSRDQISHSLKMRWPIEMIEYPLRKPLLQILLSSSKQLKYSSSFSRFYERGYILNFYKYSADGLRPVHENNFTAFESLEQGQDKFLEIAQEISKSKLWITRDNDLPFVEEDFNKYLLNAVDDGCVDVKVMEDSFLKYVPGRVSVVITTYGRSENLRFAIDSCLQQIYSDLEIIVVSDNENPAHLSAVSDIESSLNSYSNVRFIYHNANRNGAAARNTGALDSSGEYLCFLDDDDIYLQGRIKESVDLLASLPSHYGGVYCGYLGWNSSKLDEARFHEEDLFKKILTLKHSSHYIHTNTVTVRRSVFFSVNGFNEAYSRHQDLEYHLRILCNYKLKPLPKALVQLKPNVVPNSNIPSCECLKEIKMSLLHDFSREIMALGDNFAVEVWKAHNDELLRYSPDKAKPLVLPPLIVS
jgi:glycosyltransferase involved in cell wall biosynthesis/GR25 family glycosyltransferase involved in LPS biosynthesis